MTAAGALAGWQARTWFDRVVWPVTLGVMIVVSLFWIGGFYLLPDPGNLFLDAHIYFRATEAWLAGGNPWDVPYRDVPFAGIPPTLLLNLPLLPLGETAATAFWVVANSVSIIFLIRRLRLPPWTPLLLPVAEGWLAASPDLALAGLAVGGGAWIAALTKPYSVPAILAEGRWRAVAIAAVLIIVSFPVLPWATFWESRDVIARAFDLHASTPPSVAGNVVLSIVVASALASLGWRRGLSLATPGLAAQHPHHMIFSLAAITRSRILTLAAIAPAPYMMGVGIIAYAVWERARAVVATPDERGR